MSSLADWMRSLGQTPPEPGTTLQEWWRGRVEAAAVRHDKSFCSLVSKVRFYSSRYDLKSVRCAPVCYLCDQDDECSIDIRTDFAWEIWKPVLLEVYARWCSENNQ